jgi:2-C-methyl-D-erythritol 4-phosphate cytidylyltransferase/2-C-methyl-D-erythritol 2,4-cyclodiphosphate synthase
MGAVGQNRTTAAVIVAAGSGVRAGGERPKQYQDIGGSPVLRRTALAFVDHPGVSHVQVVIAPDHVTLYDETMAGLSLLPPVCGGASRQASVRAGLEALTNLSLDLVLIHDAARPFVTSPHISHVIASLDRHAAAIPALPVTDTLKRAKAGLVSATVDRAGLWAVQTPQGFRYDMIAEAHRRAAESGTTDFTDDAAIAEWAGMDVALMAGDPDNRKITSADDLKQADLRLRAQAALALGDVRVGQGFDVHSFAPGDRVTLCGIAIPHAKKLSGHSDADAALHALTDAILGTIGAGDIGQHFPPSDPQWRGADSSVFLRKALELLAERGGAVANADLTIVCEAPRIGPHVVAMRQRLSELLAIAIDRVSVKATTSEKMGFTGRGEGLAAFATVTVRLP